MNLERPAFEFDTSKVTLAEVFAAAYLGGWIWKMLVQPVTEGLACLSFAEEAGLAVDPKEIARARAKWQKERGVKDASGAIVWLSWYGLIEEDLIGYLTRRELRKRLTSRIDEALGAASVSPAEVISLVQDEATLGGLLGRVVDEVALRLSAGRALPASGAAERDSELARLYEEHGLEEKTALESAGALFGVGPTKLQELLTLEAGYRARLVEVSITAATKPGVASFDSRASKQIRSVFAPDVAKHVRFLQLDPSTR